MLTTIFTVWFRSKPSNTTENEHGTCGSLALSLLSTLSTSVVWILTVPLLPGGYADAAKAAGVSVNNAPTATEAGSAKRGSQRLTGFLRGVGVQESTGIR